MARTSKPTRSHAVATPGNSDAAAGVLQTAMHLAARAAQTAVRHLDAAHNPQLTALGAGTGAQFFGVGQALVAVLTSGYTVLSSPMTADEARALARTAAAHKMNEVVGPVGAAQPFVAALNSDGWQLTFQSIEMQRLAPAARHTTPGARHSGAETAVAWQKWLADFTAAAFPRGGRPPPVTRDQLWFWVDDGAAVAMAGALPLSSGSTRVVTVFTASEKRGRGYAGALVASLASAFEGIVTLNVESDNLPAMRAYVRAGFREIRRTQTWLRAQ